MIILFLYMNLNSKSSSKNIREIVNGVLAINGYPKSIVLISKNSTKIKSMTMCFNLYNSTKEVRYDVEGLFDNLHNHKIKVDGKYYYNLYIDKLLNLSGNILKEIRFEFINEPIKNAFIKLEKLAANYYHLPMESGIFRIQKSRVYFDLPGKQIKVNIKSSSKLLEIFINGSNNEAIKSIEQKINGVNCENMDKILIDEMMRKNNSKLINLGVNDLANEPFNTDLKSCINMSKVESYQIAIDSNEYLSFLECFIISFELLKDDYENSYITCSVSDLDTEREISNNKPIDDKQLDECTNFYDYVLDI